MHKRALLFLFLAFTIPCQVISQNLVLNFSFEEFTYEANGSRILFLSSNPLNNDALDSSVCVSDWNIPNESSPDYLIIPFVGSFLDPIVNAPNSNWGYQYARSGNAYAHFGSYKDILPSCTFTRREYIQGKLSEPLEAGAKYSFGFYAVLTEKVSTHASKIGIGFTQDSVYYNTMDCLISEGFYPDLETDEFITDTANWTRVEWVYTAIGGERFFTVGNFWCDSSESFQFVDTIGYNDCHASSYYVDDFFMYKLIDTMGIHDFYIPNIFSPNGDGNNDVFRVRGAGISEIKTFLIYDRWGEEVFQCRTSTMLIPQNAGLSVTSSECGWDGTYRGKEAPTAVYTYYVEAFLVNGETVVKRGNVTLVR